MRNSWSLMTCVRFCRLLNKSKAIFPHNRYTTNGISPPPELLNRELKIRYRIPTKAIGSTIAHTIPSVFFTYFRLKSRIPSDQITCLWFFTSRKNCMIAPTCSVCPEAGSFKFIHSFALHKLQFLMSIPLCTGLPIRNIASLR